MASLVRQAILDPFGLVHGYELIFETDRRDMEEGGGKDALAILDNLVLFGLEKLTGGARAFFQCDASVLTEDIAAVLPADKTVFQLSATMEMPRHLRTTCQKLKTAGFRFALTDVPDTERVLPLLDLAHYIKLDVNVVEKSGWASLRRRVKNGLNVMVATGVHSHDSYRKAQAEGFSYFQGLYFCRPKPVKSARIPANHRVHIEILRDLFKDPLQLHTLCPLVMREVSLVCHVLRLVNSPAYAIRGTITSVESAILILGDVAFRQIAMLAIQCSLSDGQSREALKVSLARARFCSQSAGLCNLDANEQYLLGLLSMLPVMMAVPMELIVPELPLRDRLRHALMGSPVYDRCLLDWVECHEANNTRECQAIVERYQLDRTTLIRNYIAALVWAGEELGMIA